MNKYRLIVLSLIVLFSLSSCKTINSLLHGDEIVAQVGSKYLYKSEILQAIPDDATEEDSLMLSMQYINSWAAGELLFHLADKELSAEDRDIDDELYNYKKQLLKYRYEQLFLGNKLDTVITEKQLETYYFDNKEKYRLEEPIIKARYVRLSSSSPHLDAFKAKMKSKKLEDMIIVDSLAHTAAEEYQDFSDQWVDVSKLAGFIGVDNYTLTNLISENYIEYQDFYGKIHLAQITEILGKGNIPPIEYYRGNIKDFLISDRKHDLSISLERDIIDMARDNEEYVIF